MYKIQLPNFEGPFDLLLFFIKRDELNIYDIPISKITEEFLAYIRLMKYFDLELAGEFILMASTLMQIKTQMLLPKAVIVNEDGTEEADPRAELTRKLLEYKQYKAASETLSEFEESQKYAYYRNVFSSDLSQAEEAQDYKNATLFDLMRAFKSVLDRKKVEKKEHVVQLIPMSVEERGGQIINKLKASPRLSFFEICAFQDKQVIVITFLAILDLVKNRRIRFVQSELFDDVIIAEFDEEELEHTDSENEIFEEVEEV